MIKMQRPLIMAAWGVATTLLMAACPAGTDSRPARQDTIATSGAEAEDPNLIVEGSGSRKLGPELWSIDASARQEDGRVSGSGTLAVADTEMSFTLRCTAEHVEMVMVGGTFDPGQQSGEGIALLLKDTDPVRLSVWFEDRAPPGGCRSMLANIPEDVLANESLFQPLEEGELTLGR